MAVLLPELSDKELDALPSRGEARVYRACRSLPAGVVVLHSVAGTWAARDGTLRDGEADFVLLDAAWGMLVVEVKGGGVARDSRTGRWSSVDCHGQRHPIKDPFEQAARQKYALLATLQRHADWPRGRRVNLGHAVVFPDLAPSNKPEVSSMDPLLIGTGDDLQDFTSWYGSACAAWGGADPPPGRDGLAFLRRVLAGAVESRPLVRLRLSDEEEVRVRLTAQQAGLLDYTQAHTRTSTAGGAGTGKTVLALEKARRLAARGLRTALLCYNRPLADDLHWRAGDTPGLDVLGFHQLCWREMAAVRQSTGRDLLDEARDVEPGGEEFEVLYPLALSFSIGESGSCGGYDALVVDEGQDFGDYMWVALEDLIRDSDKAELHVFHDTNQSVYGQWESPLPLPPFHLTVNCRSTKQIHDAAYRHFSGVTTRAGDLDGVAIRTLEAPGMPDQAMRLFREITRLLRDEEVQPHEMAVLIAEETPTWHVNELSRHGLPGGVRWQTLTDAPPSAGKVVRIDSVRRFKGLEAEIVFLWGIDDLEATTPRRPRTAVRRALPCRQ